MESYIIVLIIFILIVLLGIFIVPRLKKGKFRMEGGVQTHIHTHTHKTKNIVIIIAMSIMMIGGLFVIVNKQVGKKVIKQSQTQATTNVIDTNIDIEKSYGNIATVKDTIRQEWNTKCGAVSFCTSGMNRYKSLPTAQSEQYWTSPWEVHRNYCDLQTDWDGNHVDYGLDPRVSDPKQYTEHAALKGASIVMQDDFKDKCKITSEQTWWSTDGDGPNSMATRGGGPGCGDWKTLMHHVGLKFSQVPNDVCQSYFDDVDFGNIGTWGSEYQSDYYSKKLAYDTAVAVEQSAKS